MRSTEKMKHIKCSIENPKTFLSLRVLKKTIFNKGFIFLMFFDRLLTPGVGGLQEYQWNIDYSLEHQTTSGRNVKNFNTC